MSEAIIKSHFPTQLESNETKLSAEHGLEVAKAIEREWFTSDSGENRFYSNQTTFHNLRLYARGEQSIQKYKDELAVDGDLSYLNLDWKIVPIVPKFVDILVNGISERSFDPKAYSIDEFGVDKRSKYMESMLREMDTQELNAFAAEAFGVDLAEMAPADVPADMTELEVRMMRYKDGAEIAEEEAIAKVWADNKYHEKSRQVIYDLVTIGIGARKTEFNTSEGIVNRWVDPVNLVWSYTEDPYFRDCYYFGEVKLITINELVKKFPYLANDPEKLKRISEQGIQSTNYYDRTTTAKQEVDTNTVQILEFEYKTFLTEHHKVKTTANGLTKAIVKDEDWAKAMAEDATEDPRNLFDTVETPYETLFEGCYVLGTDILLQWEQAKNQVRSKSNINKVFMNYSVCAPRMYQGRIESIVSRITGFANMVQLTHLKLQQVLAKMLPDGIYIDADGLTDIDLGNGTKYNPAEAVKMFFQTGSIIGRSFTGEGDMNPGKVPIQEISHNSGGNKIQALIASYNQYLQMIRDVTGLNEARDGSTPDERALVGVQKLAAANSNTATRHILDANIAISEHDCMLISLRISDVLEHSPMRDEWIASISAYNVAILEELKELHLRDFGIILELEPDEEEKQMLEQNIQIALGNGLIDLDDAIDIREVRNIKTANQLLKIAKRKKAEREQQANQANIEAQAQANAQMQQAQAQTEMQKKQVETQFNMQELQAEDEIAARALARDVKAKKELMRYEADLAIEVQRATAMPTIKDAYMEDRKDSREQAKDQTKQAIAKHKFESRGNDTTSNTTGLGNFNPR